MGTVITRSKGKSGALGTVLAVVLVLLVCVAATPTPTCTPTPTGKAVPTFKAVTPVIEDETPTPRPSP